MKKAVLLSFLLFTLITCWSQSFPTGMSYQAILTDQYGDVLEEQLITLRISIYEGSTTGTLSWQEKHVVTTTDKGHVVLTIGSGTRISGTSVTYGTINWSGAVHFYKVEVDSDGSGSYLDMGTTQFLSVPYAEFAKTSGDGPPGTNGNTILSGNASPSLTDGVDGDFFLNTMNYYMYGPKLLGVWGNPTAIQGGNIDPDGNIGNTIYHDGIQWKAASNIYNDGTYLGIGTNLPTAPLTLAPATGSNATIQFTGTDLARIKGSNIYLETDYLGIDVGASTFPLRSVFEFTSYGLTINSSQSTLDPSAILNLKSNDQGVLFPRMLESEKLAISNPDEGLMVYDSTYKQFFYRRDTSWVSIPYRSTAINNVVYAASAFKAAGAGTSDFELSDITAEFAYFPIGAGAAYAAANVSLPDGATITNIELSAIDNSAGDNLTFDLYEGSISIASAATSGASASLQTISSSTQVPVDNSLNAYTLVVKFDSKGNTQSVLSFSKIKISYDY